MESPAPPPTPAAVRPTFGLVVLAAGAAALVGLPLFQDGSSYLLELLTTGSAIRHERLSAVALQIPAIVAHRVLPSDAPWSLPVIRALFAVGYTAVPVLALGLAWWIVAPMRPAMLLWPALVILFANLVDFSWVSELLIAVQLSWPLLLVAVLAPGSRRAWVTTAILLPAIWSLHPLSAVLLATLAAAALYVGSQDPERRAAVTLGGVYGLAAIARVLVAPATLTPYESSFLATPALLDYLFVGRWENVLVLIAALVIAVVVLRTRTAARDPETVRRAYRVAGGVATGAAAVLVSQYFVPTQTFPLKTGLVVFVASAVMLCAARDACTPPCSAGETTRRLDLTRVLAAVFAAVVAVKCLVWHTATSRLVESVVSSEHRCQEIDALPWLHRAPYTIIDNWALPSLTLVLQDHPPRNLLLATGDCRRFVDEGVVQVDPWSVMPTRVLVPKLD